MNSFHIVGHYHSAPKRLEGSTSKLHSQFWVSSKPNFLRPDLIDEMDLFPIIGWKGLSSQFIDSLKIGDLICVRGRIVPFEGSFRFIAEVVEDLSNHMVNF